MGTAKISYTTGRTVTVKVFDGASLSTQRNTGNEGANEESTGLYESDYALIEDGDFVVAFDSGVYIGGERYDSKLSSEVNLALKTTISARTVGVDSVFDLAAGSSDTGAYKYMVASVEDISGNVIESRRITSYVVSGSQKRVTVDAALSFPLAIDDVVKIYASTYSTTAEAAAAAQIADAVWDEPLKDHKTTRTTGNKLRKLGTLNR